MNYMVIQLYKPNCLDDLMLALTAHDVRDAVVLDAKAVGSTLMQDVPIFAGFRVDLDEPHGAMKFVLAVVRDAAHACAIRDELVGAGLDLSDPAVAKVFLLPIETLG